MSNGPRMTVSKISDEKSITCIWFDQVDGCWRGPFTEIFDIDSLIEVE